METVKLLGDGLRQAQRSCGCLQIDRNYSGDPLAFEKGVVGDKTLSGNNDKRTGAENERAAG